LEEDEIVTQSYDNDEMGTTSTPPPPPVHDDDEPQQQLKQKEQSDVARVLSWTRMPAATGGRVRHFPLFHPTQEPPPHFSYFCPPQEYNFI